MTSDLCFEASVFSSHGETNNASTVLFMLSAIRPKSSKLKGPFTAIVVRPGKTSRIDVGARQSHPLRTRGQTFTVPAGQTGQLFIEGDDTTTIIVTTEKGVLKKDE